MAGYTISWSTEQGTISLMSSCFLALWQCVCRGPSGEKNVVGDGVGQLAGRQQQQPLPAAVWWAVAKKAAATRALSQVSSPWRHTSSLRIYCTEEG